MARRPVRSTKFFKISGFNAIFQNCVYGVAARLPAAYMGAVVLGCNVCGTLVVLLSWMSKNFGDLRTAAIYYFIGGMFVLLICFDSYFALPLNVSMTSDANGKAKDGFNALDDFFGIRLNCFIFYLIPRMTGLQNTKRS